MSTGGFAAAQERVLARQETRRKENEAILQTQQSAIRDSALSRLPFPFNRTAGPLTSLWTTLIQFEGTRPAVRVGQVDAELLDEELVSLLKGQVGEGLKYFGQHVQDDWSQEISLGLRAILFKLSIWDNDASYGAALQGLRFTDARAKAGHLSKPTQIQKSLYGLITVFGRYGYQKWEDWLTEQEGGYSEPSESVQKLSRITSRISAAHSIVAFVSFVVFLINGRYRTLIDRILRMRLVSPINQVNREVSFEYLNRQLVWHAFTEFLLFLLPIVGIGRWRRWLSRAWRRSIAALQTENLDGTAEELKTGPLAYLPERTCAICYQDQNPEATSESELLGANVAAGGGVIGSASTDVVNPYETIPCGCIYCFVCLASKIQGEEGGGWTCLRCGKLVYRCKPWSGDVLVSKETKPGKSVGFVDDKEKASKDGEDLSEPLESGLDSSGWTLEDSGFKDGHG